MKILNAKYLISSDCLKNCPKLNMPEIAMIGRSNVGKSSFINTICSRKNMARTSNTPGKTRLLNYYLINENFAMVDLPGYGYAKLSKTEQEKWRKNLESYLLNREELVAVIQLIDSRHDVQANDIQMREWLEHYNIPIITVATKVDTISKNKMTSATAKIAKTFDCEVIPFSSKTGLGKDKILALLDEYLK